jgi:hypothetical protein
MTRTPSPDTRKALPWVRLIGLASVVVLATALLDRTTAHSHTALARLACGRPLAWALQDQSSADPPLPDRRAFASPWEHPTGVDALPLLLDLALALSLLVVLWRTAGRLAGRRTGRSE